MPARALDHLRVALEASSARLGTLSVRLHAVTARPFLKEHEYV